MKRSEINKYISDALIFIYAHKFKLPPFVTRTYSEWQKIGNNVAEYAEIKDAMLGWDITDFGSGDYHKVGLLLITLRNGNINSQKYSKPYAEKLMIVEDGQVTPYHFHWNKMEDIINRGGGNLIVKCYNSSDDGEMLDTPVTVISDGRRYTASAGEKVVICEGESITLPAGQYHTFWAENGKTLVGEVSKLNDDHVDNRFYEKIGRFPDIDEDASILYPLFSEYPF